MGRTEDRREAAVRRALEAQDRTDELVRRLERLRAGEPSSADSVDEAKEAARRSAHHAVEAHAAAVAAHLNAAERHRQAAELAARLGRADDAERHLRAAQADVAAAEQARAAGSD